MATGTTRGSGNCVFDSDYWSRRASNSLHMGQERPDQRSENGSDSDSPRVLRVLEAAPDSDPSGDRRGWKRHRKRESRRRSRSEGKKRMSLLDTIGSDI